MRRSPARTTLCSSCGDAARVPTTSRNREDSTPVTQERERAGTLVGEIGEIAERKARPAEGVVVPERVGRARRPVGDIEVRLGMHVVAGRRAEGPPTAGVGVAQ